MKSGMNNPIISNKTACYNWRSAALAILALAGLLFARLDVSAQTTNAYDTAANPAYSGDDPRTGWAMLETQTEALVSALGHLPS